MKAIEALRTQFPLRGEKVRVELFTAQNLTHNYVSWLNDPDVVRFSNQRFRHHTLESCKQYFQDSQSGNCLFLALYCMKRDLFVGTMAVHFNPAHETADMGILIGESACHGEGIGKEAWCTVMHFLLQGARVRKVTGGTLSCNTPMLKIMQSAGMQADGVRKQQELVDGEAFDIMHYALFS